MVEPGDVSPTPLGEDLLPGATLGLPAEPPAADQNWVPEATGGEEREADGTRRVHRSLLQHVQLAAEDVNAHLAPLLDLVADRSEAVICPLGSWTLATQLAIWATPSPDPTAIEHLARIASWSSTHPELRAVFAVWLRERIPTTEGVVGSLTGDPAADQAMVDTWASVATDGLILKMPVKLTEQTSGLAAHAALLKTEWRNPFDVQRHVTIPATQRRLPEGNWLRQMTGVGDIGIVMDAHQPSPLGGHDKHKNAEASWARIRGGTADVWLCCSPERGLSGRQLALLALEVAVGRATTKLGTQLEEGDWGGLVVVRETAQGQPFDVPTQSWVLCHPFDVTASTALEGHPAFVSILGQPLHGLAGQTVTGVAQSARARFDDKGFEAAAVTAAQMADTAAWDDEPPLTYDARTVATMIADDLVGFVAVDTDTGIVLFGGWVQT